MFLQLGVISAAMSIETKKHPKTVVNFVENLRHLIEGHIISKADLEKKSGVSGRHIDFMLKYERYPSIEVADKIGSALGLTGWQMLIPGLPYDLAKSGKIDSLIREYSESSKATQDYVSEVLHRERKAL